MNARKYVQYVFLSWAEKRQNNHIRTIVFSSYANLVRSFLPCYSAGIKNSEGMELYVRTYFVWRKVSQSDLLFYDYIVHDIYDMKGSEIDASNKMFALFLYFIIIMDSNLTFFLLPPSDGQIQRVLNDSYRTRLSRRRMIWLLPHPSPVSKLDRRHTGRLWKRDNLPTWGWEGGGGDAKPHYHTTARKPGPP
jgi:hypothetical protein